LVLTAYISILDATILLGSIVWKKEEMKLGEYVLLYVGLDIVIS